jgi:hypothetical protein
MVAETNGRQKKNLPPPSLLDLGLPPMSSVPAPRAPRGRVRAGLAVVAVALVVAGVVFAVSGGGGEPAGPPLWRVDYETGDLRQWDGGQQATEGRIAVVEDPVEQGRYAARFEARQNEFTGGDTTANRSELLLTRYRDRVGDERWYRWSTLVPEDFPPDQPEAFASIMQWQRDDNQSPLPLGFGIRGHNLRITSGGTRYLGRVEFGRWLEFLVHVKWSTDPEEGFVEVWLDGDEILPRTKLQTVFTDAEGQPIGHYIKQGLYKSNDLPTAHVFHDGMLIGATRGSVDR